MYSKIITELNNDIKKLHTLEDSIITGDYAEDMSLRSKQALLISDIIQSLERVKNTIQQDVLFAPISDREPVLAE